MKNRSFGMVLPLSLFAIVAVLGLVASMTDLGQGVRTQAYRADNQQLSFLIAYSAADLTRMTESEFPAPSPMQEQDYQGH